MQAAYPRLSILGSSAKFVEEIRQDPHWHPPDSVQPIHQESLCQRPPSHRLRLLHSESPSRVCPAPRPARQAPPWLTVRLDWGTSPRILTLVPSPFTGNHIQFWKDAKFPLKCLPPAQSLALCQSVCRGRCHFNSGPVTFQVAQFVGSQPPLGVLGHQQGITRLEIETGILKYQNCQAPVYSVPSQYQCHACSRHPPTLSDSVAASLTLPLVLLWKIL